MNKIVYGSVMVLGLALAGPAFAADIPLKAPPPVYSDWTGSYIGVEVGGKWKTDNWTTNCVEQLGGPIFGCGTKNNHVQFPGAPDASSPHDFKTSGVRAGGYIGFNLQNQNWVYGVEGDWAYYNQSDSVLGLVGCSTFACAHVLPLAPFTDRTSVTNKFDVSLRLRGGYLVTPDVLIYATGGAAWQAIDATMHCASSATSPACIVPHTETHRNLLPGWTVGGGLEWKVWQNILLRGEYRFADFGNRRSNFFVNSGDVELLGNIHVRSNIATLGIAYKFGGGAVAARY